MQTKPVLFDDGKIDSSCVDDLLSSSSDSDLVVVVDASSFLSPLVSTSSDGVVVVDEFSLGFAPRYIFHSMNLE